MKKLKYSKKIKDETNAFSKLIESYCNKIRKEYQKNCLEQMNKLISDISLGEGLDELELREKYLNVKKKRKDKKSITKKVANVKNESILDKIVLDNKTYYYENKEDGIVFDSESNPVGNFSKNQFSINEKVLSI